MPDSARSDFARLGADDARDMIDAGRVTVLDIRDEQSFAAGRISDSRHIDNASVPAFVADHPPEDAVIVCCYHGHSSQQAAAWLVAQGLREVYSLDGGFTEWAIRFPDDVDEG